MKKTEFHKAQTDERFRALLKQDRNIEGRYYLANKSVKIYCGRICGGKVPLEKNVEIFTHQAAAEAAVYRPCRMCRPELAPNHTSVEMNSELSRTICFNVNRGYLANHSLKELAGKLHTTEVKLQSFFTKEFGVAPPGLLGIHVNLRLFSKM